MRTWTPEQVARAAGARLVSPPPTSTGPEGVVIDSRQAGPGALFVGLQGEHVDGGRFAAQALAAGAWGVLTTPEHAEAARCAVPGALIAADDPLAAMQRLATAWRRALDVQVIGVTGSTGKTSTKDLLLALLSPHRRTVASRANFNTEIGVPLEILSAPADTEVLVLEMAMRGAGQIAELAAIAEPDVGVIVSIGPVHLELLGTIEAIAAAKAELIAALLPAPPRSSRPTSPCWSRICATISRRSRSARAETSGSCAPRRPVEIDLAGERIVLEVPFRQAHLRRNLLPAAAAAKAVGVVPAGRVALELTAGRGQHLDLPGGVTLIDGCYNANPMSMRAALEDLVATAARSPGARPVAVLGDMLELGPRGRDYHLELGEEVGRAGVELLVTVGPLAAAIAERFDGERYSVADAAEAAGSCPSWFARATSSWSRRRSGWASSGCAARSPLAAGARWHRQSSRGGGMMGSVSGRVLIAGTASLLLCLFLSPKFIEFLRRREFGQNIREEGPEGHKIKAGTPTMGGIIIMVAFAVPFLILSTRDWASIGVLGGTLACALLGFADDYTKIVKRRSLGLRARTKLVVTVAISLGLWWVATQKAGVNETLNIRFVDLTVDLGPLYPVLIYLVVAGTTSSVNLTDGLDGLAAGCAAIVLLAYIGINFISGEADLTVLAACLVGACIGFLWFNSFPASIFMGDTGSLGIGGAIAGLAVMTNTEVLLILLGGIFVIEALSVLIQVFSFQMFRKRVFLMAPIHHHFELQAWSETKIILRFWIVAAACAAIAFTVYRLSIRG